MVFIKNVLNKKHVLVCVLVVVSLFLTFISQTLNTSTHFISCENGTDCTIVSTKNSSQNSEDHHEETNCDDPCHVGFSHFGHCAMTLQNSNFNLDAVSLNKEIAYYNLFMKDPFIKGLRRPPRAA